MTTAPTTSPLGTASRVILATPRTLYRACLDRETIPSWRVPEGMRVEISAFEPRIGGGYRMALHWVDALPGADALGVEKLVAEFVELLPEEKIVERIHLEISGTVCAEPMTITTTFLPVRDGTKVTFRCENMPAAVDAEDHAKRMASSLRRLALLTE